MRQARLFLQRHGCAGHGGHQAAIRFAGHDLPGTGAAGRVPTHHQDLQQSQGCLALFNLAIDSKLRGCDLVRLRVLYFRNLVQQPGPRNASSSDCAAKDRPACPVRIDGTDEAVGRRLASAIAEMSGSGIRLVRAKCASSRSRVPCSSGLLSRRLSQSCRG